MTSMTSPLNMEGMSDEAQRATLAAAAYATRKEQKCMHEMTFGEFYDLIGLPGQPDRRHLISLLLEMRRATGSGVDVDSRGEENHRRPNGSWPVFISVALSHTHVSFKVCPYIREVPGA